MPQSVSYRTSPCYTGPSTPKICATQQRNAIPLKCVLQVDKAKDHFPSVALANANRCVRNSEKKERATQQKPPQRKSFVNRVALDTEADTEPASREKTSASFEGGRTRGPAGGGTLKEASWRARARQVPFLRPLWEGSHSQTRPTRAAHTRARVARGASEPKANIACSERIHARLGGEAALLKLLTGGKHRALSVSPVPHRTTAAVPCPLDPAT